MKKMEHPLASFKYCPKCGFSHFVENDEKSKRCLDCGFIYYFNPSAAAVAVILNSKKEILVSRRAKEPAKGTLDLPGGFCDCKETGEETIVREIREETGMKVVSTRFLFSFPDLYLYSGFMVHTVDMFFLCTVEDDSVLFPDDDVSELLWIPIEKLNVKDFGLVSIKQAVEKLQKENYFLT